jgi:hypothetical protein
MVGGVTALTAIGAFLFKQWNSYKNRKIKFMKALGDRLYFNNLDNNAAGFYVGQLLSGAFAGIRMIPSFWRPQWAVWLVRLSPPRLLPVGNAGLD